jgi:Fungal protein kinase
LIVGSGELADRDAQLEPKIEGGMLIDWDLSEIVDSKDGSSTGPRYARTVSWLHETVYTTLDICFRQGTWAFMAADVVKSSGITQTFVHDLESVFWVLLWITLNYVETSWGIGERSYFCDSVFSMKVFGDSGGNSKMNFLCNDDALSFEIPHNSPLFALLGELKDLLSARHRKIPMAQSKLESKADRLAGAKRDVYMSQLKHLEDHRGILSLFKTSLDPPNIWPVNDKASFQPIVLSKAEENVRQSGTKRLRSMYEDAVRESSSSSKRRQT